MVVHTSKGLHRPEGTDLDNTLYENLNADMTIIDGYLHLGGSYTLAATTVDHDDLSPVDLGDAPANSFVQLFVVCTEVPTGPPAVTLGDENDADSHFTYAQLPQTLNASAVSPFYFYSVLTQLRATIPTPGSAGKWYVIPKIVISSS